MTVQQTTRLIYSPHVTVIDLTENTITVYEDYREQSNSTRLTDAEFDARLAELSTWARDVGLIDRPA